MFFFLYYETSILKRLQYYIQELFMLKVKTDCRRFKKEFFYKKMWKLYGYNWYVLASKTDNLVGELLRVKGNQVNVRRKLKL